MGRLPRQATPLQSPLRKGGHIRLLLRKIGPWSDDSQRSSRRSNFFPPYVAAAACARVSPAAANCCRES